MLFCIGGIGYGHVIRLCEILKHLPENLLDRTVVVTYGDAARLIREKSIQEDRLYRVRLVEIGGITADFNLPLFTQIILNASIPFTFAKDVAIISDLIERDPDKLMIVDTDIYVGSLLRFFKSKCSIIFYSNFFAIKEFFDVLPNKEEYTEEKKMLDRFLDDIADYSDVYTTYFIPGGKNYVGDFVREQYPQNPRWLDLLINSIDEGYILAVPSGNITAREFVMELVESLEERVVVVNAGVQRGIEIRGGKIYLPFVNNMKKVIEKAAAVISTAGNTTIIECLINKKPIYTVPLSNHLEQNVNSAVLYVRNLGGSALFETFEEFLNRIDNINQELEKYRLEKNAAEELANIIVEYIKG